MSDHPSAPRVSVVMPTRDRWPLLSRALASVLAQESVALEVLVVDDGSRDGTPERLRGVRDPRLRVIARPSSGGVARARNLAIAEARGAWVAFLDDDDLWAPQKLRCQLEAAAPDVALVYTGAVIVDKAARMIRPRPTRPAVDVNQGLLETNLVGTPSSVMARTEALRRLGGFDESLSTLADWDLWIRLLETGRAVLRPELLTAYTVHPDNMHLGQPAALRRELRGLRAKHRRACVEHGVELGGIAFSKWLVRRYRDAGMRGAASRLYLSMALRSRSARDVALAAGVLAGERAMRLAALHRAERSGGELVLEPDWLPAIRRGEHGQRLV